MIRKTWFTSAVGLAFCIVACGGGSAADSSRGSGEEPGSSPREPGATGPESAQGGSDPAGFNGDAPGCLTCGQLYKCAATLPGAISDSTTLIALPGEGCPIPSSQSSSQNKGASGSSSNGAGSSGSSGTGSGDTGSSKQTQYLQLSCGGVMRVVSSDGTANASTVIGTWKRIDDRDLLACFGVLGSNVCVRCELETQGTSSTVSGSGSSSSNDAGL